MKRLILTLFFSSLLLIYTWSWILCCTWSGVVKSKEPIPTRRIVPLCKRYFNQEISEATQKLSSTNHCLQNATLHGKVPETLKFLAIGIPSVDRPKDKYLHKTLASLTKDLDDDERKSLVIVVFIADAEENKRRKRADEVQNAFETQVQSGLILVIQDTNHPELEITRRTFNDSLERVRWRTKQVLDFVFLLRCSQNAAEYFLILEDDIEVSPHYVSAIRNFIATRERRDWISLTFSGFFIIGRLFKSSILPRLTEFLLLFHMEQPVDLLVLQFLDLMVPDKSMLTRRIPGLFQHIGLFSSLPGKIQKARDSSYLTAGRYGNPPADIVTTLGVYKKHYPELCYAPSKQFFWGGAPKVNDTFDVVLHRPTRVKKIKVVSGMPGHRNDVIRFAELKVSASFNRMVSNNKADCSNFYSLALFEKGAVDMSFSNATQVVVQCLRIEFIKKQSNWILIKEIIIQEAEVSSWQTS